MNETKPTPNGQAAGITAGQPNDPPDGPERTTNITRDSIRVDPELVIIDDFINARIEMAGFDIEKRLGITLGADENINFYANYYPDTRRLSHYLQLSCGDRFPRENDLYKLDLSDSEKQAILELMEEAGLSGMARMMQEPTEEEGPVMGI